jgi:mannose-6-phosphate isomerase-like protein (cupin superfamily)
MYVLSGEAVGLLGEHEVPLKAGQVLHIDKNVSHGIRNAGTGTLELLIIASPPY